MSLMLRRFVVGPLKTNVYMVMDLRGNSILIDAGPGSLDRVLYYIDREGIKVKYIFITHGHFDHVSDAQFIKEITNAKIVMHEADIQLLSTSRDISRYFNVKWKDPEIDVVLSKDLVMAIEGLGIEVKVICTPGHTRGSVSFFFKNFKWLFTGDTLFKGTIGRTDFLESSPTDMVKSLLKLMELPNDVIVYPGHGDRTTLGMEKINNPYLLDLMRKV